jgi:hypothetical protein
MGNVCDVKGDKRWSGGELGEGDAVLEEVVTGGEWWGGFGFQDAPWHIVVGGRMV